MADSTLLSKYLRRDDFASGDLSQFNFRRAFQAGALALLGTACSADLLQDNFRDGIIRTKAEGKKEALSLLDDSVVQKISRTIISDRERDGFKGKVRRVSEWWSPLSEAYGIPLGSRCRREGTEYDEQGRRTARLVYALDELKCDGKEIRGVFEYDDKGNAIEIYPVEVGRIYKYTFKYDDEGREIEQSVFGVAGALYHKVTYTYDSQGRCNGFEQSNNDGILARREKRIFGDKGQFPSEIIRSDPNGRQLLKITYSKYEANSLGDWIKRTEVMERFDGSSEGKRVAFITRDIDYY